MNTLLIGQRYILTRIHDEKTKQPMNSESLVEILKKCRKDGSNIVTVKYITGHTSKINTVQEICYDNYEFDFAEDKYKEMQEEFMRFKVMEREVRANFDNYLEIKDEVHTKIRQYKEMEWEIMFLRFAFIIIIWMYIKGIIKMG